MQKPSNTRSNAILISSPGFARAAYGIGRRVRPGHWAASGTGTGRRWRSEHPRARPPPGNDLPFSAPLPAGRNHRCRDARNRHPATPCCSACAIGWCSAGALDPPGWKAWAPRWGGRRRTLRGYGQRPQSPGACSNRLDTSLAVWVQHPATPGTRQGPRTARAGGPIQTHKGGRLALPCRFAASGDPLLGVIQHSGVGGGLDARASPGCAKGGAACCASGQGWLPDGGHRPPPQSTCS